VSVSNVLDLAQVHLLAWSSALQFFNTHGVTAAVTLSLPVVHWHAMSSTEHPAAAAPLVKQVKAHAGMTLRSTVTARAADERERSVRTDENFILTIGTNQNRRIETLKGIEDEN